MLFLIVILKFERLVMIHSKIHVTDENDFEKGGRFKADQSFAPPNAINLHEKDNYGGIHILFIV